MLHQGIGAGVNGRGRIGDGRALVEREIAIAGPDIGQVVAAGIAGNKRAGSVKLSTGRSRGEQAESEEGEAHEAAGLI